MRLPRLSPREKNNVLPTLAGIVVLKSVKAEGLIRDRPIARVYQHTHTHTHRCPPPSTPALVLRLPLHPPASQHLGACIYDLCTRGVRTWLFLPRLYLATLPHATPMHWYRIDASIYAYSGSLARAIETATALGCEYISVDQTELHDKLSAQIDEAVGVPGGAFAQGQLRSYMRTPSVYYIAQLLSQAGTPCVVMGTGNQDEDGYLAYFCKVLRSRLLRRKCAVRTIGKRGVGESAGECSHESVDRGDPHRSPMGESRTGHPCALNWKCFR